jgi:hypothetical protein
MAWCLSTIASKGSLIDTWSSWTERTRESFRRAGETFLQTGGLTWAREKENRVTLQAIGTIGVFAAILWLPTVTLVGAYLFRRLQTQERLRAIEKGLEMGFDPEAHAASARRIGIVLIAAAVGIALAVGIITLVSREPEAMVGLALAVVPAAIGVGFLIDYRIGRRRSERTQ